jgi:DNA uptake protein ComE-like DNA-binding protein
MRVTGVSGPYGLLASLAGALLGTLAGTLAAAASPDSALLAQEGVSLKAVCSKCHNLQIVTSARMSYDGWHDTVQKMLDRGAVGTEDQLNDVMDYLHRTQTTIDVNSADRDELALVLGAGDAAVSAIIARRVDHRFVDLQDLKSIPGLEAKTLNDKAALLFFQ